MTMEAAFGVGAYMHALLKDIRADPKTLRVYYGPVEERCEQTGVGQK